MYTKDCVSIYQTKSKMQQNIASKVVLHGLHSGKLLEKRNKIVHQKLKVSTLFRKTPAHCLIKPGNLG